MRHKRALNDNQLKYLIKNSSFSNIDLAERLKVSPQLIATYRYRAKKAGVEMPTPIRKNKSTIASRIKELSK